MSEANLFSEGDPELLEQAGQLLSEAKQAHDHMDTLLQEENSRQAREISSSSTPLPSVQDLVEQDKLCQYTRWLMTLHHLKETCLELLEAGRILPELRTAFVNLRTLHVSLDGPSRCRHLSLYAGGTLTGLYKIVADRLVQGLERELEHLNFPACILAEDQCVSLSGGGPETLNKFRSHFTFLSSLIPLLEGEGSSLSITPVRPHTILFHPLRKRFQYHFCGTKKTNNLVRPEWYLQQVLVWLKNSFKFYEFVLCPGATPEATDEFVQLCQKISQMVTDKLAADTQEFVKNDVLLSHVIDEVIVFSKAVNEIEIADSLPMGSLPISVLAHDKIFSRWLSLERKLAFEKLDSLFLDDAGLMPSVSDPILLRCVETFLTLLQSLFSRFKELKDPELQFKFVRLQCDLVEDFRMRLVQILRQEQNFPLSDKFCLILSAAHHLIEVLSSWNETPLYLHLQYVMNDDDMLNSVTEGFSYLIVDRVNSLSMYIYYEAKARSGSYRSKTRWYGSNPDVFDGSPCVESLGMLQSLTTNLHRIQAKLKPPLFLQVLERVLKEISEFYVKDVICMNMFDDTGIEQLGTDINRGIIPIFKNAGDSSLSPQCFGTLQETLSLLTMKRPSAVLLLESVMTPISKDQALDASSTSPATEDLLTEFKLNSLSRTQVGAILKRRSDLIDIL